MRLADARGAVARREAHSGRQHAARRGRGWAAEMTSGWLRGGRARRLGGRLAGRAAAEHARSKQDRAGGRHAQPERRGARPVRRLPPLPDHQPRLRAPATSWRSATTRSQDVEGWRPIPYDSVHCEASLADVTAHVGRGLRWYRSVLPDDTRYHLIGYSLGGVALFEAAGGAAVRRAGALAGADRLADHAGRAAVRDGPRAGGRPAGRARVRVAAADRRQRPGAGGARQRSAPPRDRRAAGGPAAVPGRRIC